MEDDEKTGRVVSVVITDTIPAGADRAALEGAEYQIEIKFQKQYGEVVTLDKDVETSFGRVMRLMEGVIGIILEGGSESMEEASRYLAHFVSNILRDARETFGDEVFSPQDMVRAMLQTFAAMSQEGGGCAECPDAEGCANKEDVVCAGSSPLSDEQQAQVSVLENHPDFKRKQ